MPQHKHEKDTIYIFTDGACRGNPGPGGWGALMRYRDAVKELKGAEANTTNNRMELQAVISALQALKKKDLPIEITTDSKYVQKGMTEWMPKWKRGRLYNKNSSLKNKDLWIKLDGLASLFDIKWCWIKGHAGHKENERADSLANEAIDELVG